MKDIKFEYKKLGDVATFKKGQGLSKEQLTDTGKFKCIHYGELFNVYNEVICEVVSKTNFEGKTVSTGNETLVPTSDVTPYGLAKSSAINEKGVILGGDILIIESDTIYNKYLSYFYTHSKKEVLKLVTGSTVYHIYEKDLKKLVIPICSLETQKKISHFFTSIDNIIEQYEEVVKNLEDQKKYYMNMIFSNAKGTSIVRLGDITDIKKGTQINKLELLDKGKYKYYNGGINHSGYLDIYNCESNSIAISEGGNSCGHIRYVEEKFYSGGHNYTLTNRSKYLYYILKHNENKIKSLRVGSGLPNIQKKQLMSLEITYHEKKDDQLEISQYLTEVDGNIVNYTNLINHYINMKKYYLETIFNEDINDKK